MTRNNLRQDQDKVERLCVVARNRTFRQIMERDHHDPLKKALDDSKPPYCTGIVTVAPRDVVLYYSNDDGALG